MAVERVPTEDELWIGIVGSRRRNTLTDRKIVFDIVRAAVATGKRVVVVSGGCKGPDRFAEEAADFYGAEKEIHPILKEPPIASKYEFTMRAHARNRTIAERSRNGLFCLVADDRTGGTENTVSHGLDLQRRVRLVDRSGRVYLP